jgi:outer membrane protein assembly factor BamD (BamD/ComL family)
MDRARRIIAIVLLALVAACASTSDRATLAQLRSVNIEIKEERIEDGIDRAIQGYERFLAETTGSPMASEAMRRLADLKIEKEYGVIGTTSPQTKTESSVSTAMDRPESYDAAKARQAAVTRRAEETASSVTPGGKSESERDFEKRATVSAEIKGAAQRPDEPLPAGADLEKAGARDAIELYKQLLVKYPLYDRKDQVLYSMSRAYEELGQVEEAMTVMNRLVKEHPESRYFDEVEFRRGEYFFTRKKFLDAEDAYKAVADRGARSSFYELALYKLGWSFYKQELYEDALNRFIALLDYKQSTGFDFESSRDELERKRVEDTYRVISLSFSNSGGSSAVDDYFAKRGHQPYEVDIYRNLGEFYLEKRRYNDAAVTYKAFVTRNPLHKVSPNFDMQVIDIYKKGSFPKLVIDSTKDFARSYGLKSEYWKHFDPKTHPEVVGYLKTNLKELANHYHALYQDKRLDKAKDANFQEALTWYREFLDSFPRDTDASVMNYQFADVILENKMFGDAAREYEKTAYDYPAHEKAAAAGYAAVYAHREALKIAAPATRDTVKQDIIRSSLKFADTFPMHEKAAVVLGAAADDLYEMKDYERTIATAHKLIDQFPKAEQDIRRAAWLVVAHASFALEKFEDAEKGYVTVVQLTAETDKTREAVIDNLAASVYKQGEQARKRGDHKAAADQFLRIATIAPTSKIRPTAEYDAATALLQIKEWGRAVEILEAFRKNYPANELQPEVTKKIALAHKEAGNLALAAAEYERVETESKEDELRRGALSLAAELYEQAGQTERASRVYRRYVEQFPRPLEFALEARHKLARLYKSANDNKSYLSELRQIVDSDARAGGERTDRTRYLAAVSALALTEPHYERFVEIKLVKPFEKNLARKKAAMKEATDAFGKLAGYQAGEATAAAAFYIAEIYYHFGKALTESERPDNLSATEREQYELALEEQAYPFEEKAIKLHEKNLELLSVGVYNAWIDKSIERLAQLMPARYARAEENPGFIDSIGPYRYVLVTKPSSPEVSPRKDVQPAQSESGQLSGTERPEHGESSAASAQ